jgi:PAS domain S-box-containing protein
MILFATVTATCLIMGFLAAYAWRRRSVQGASAYSGMALSQSLLALCEMLSMLSPSPEGARFWFQARYTCATAMSILWLVFALDYSGRKKMLSWRFLAAGLAIPVFTQVLLWVPGLKGLWMQREAAFSREGAFWIADVGSRIPGVGFVAHVFYSITLTFCGIAFLLAAAWRKPRKDGIRTLWVSLSAATAAATALIASFKLIPGLAFNPFTPGMGLAAILISVAVFRFRLFSLTARGPGSEPGSTADARGKRDGHLFLLMFIVFCTGMMTIGYLTIQRFNERFRIQVENRLNSIAELKVNWLTEWRSNKLGDAEAIRNNPVFQRLASRFLRNPSDAESRKQLEAWFLALNNSHEYIRISLLDTKCRDRISIPRGIYPVPEHLQREMTALLGVNKTDFLDFHCDSINGPVHLSLTFPVRDPDKHGPPSGLIVIRIDPGRHLYPLIREWPLPSKSAETLIVRREGDDVLFLNDTRFRPGSALTLRYPVDTPLLPAAMAVSGQNGIVQGKDYRGVPVVAAVRSVPDSPWFIIAREDISESFAPLRTRIRETIFFFAVMIIATGLGLWLIWRTREMGHQKASLRAAANLRESLDRFRMANRATFDVIWDWNVSTGHFWVNENFGAAFGYRPEEIGLDLQTRTARIHPEDAGLVDQSLREAMRSGRESWSAQYRFLRRDGRYAEVEDRSIISRNAKGEPVRVIGAMQDITGKKRVENEILAAQSELKRLLDKSDKSRRILLSVLEDRKKAEEALGRMNVELEQRVRNRTAELDRRSRELAVLYSVASSTARSLEMETVLNHALDSVLRSLDLEIGGIYLMEPDGETLRLRVIRGVSEETARDLRLVKKGEGMSGKTVADRKPMVLDVDEYPSGRLLPFVQREGIKSSASIPLMWAGEVLGALNLSSRKPRAFPAEEIHLLTTIGQQLGNALQNANLFEATQHQTVQLAAANRELELFSYSVSHDLRSPLRGIDGWSLALIEDYGSRLEDKAVEYLGRIRHETGRMDRLIDDMLHLSRITRAEMRRQNVDLSALAERILVGLKEGNPGRRMVISVKPDLQADADPALLDILLTNLLSNAWKFTARREPAEIAFDRIGDAFRVRDNGAGFDPKYADKLFVPFQRLHRQSEFPGNGIGLAIVQRIAVRHGGRVWAESEPDKGSSFYFTLGEIK